MLPPVGYVPRARPVRGPTGLLWPVPAVEFPPGHPPKVICKIPYNFSLAKTFVVVVGLGCFFLFLSLRWQ